MQTKPVYVVRGEVHGVTYYLQADKVGTRERDEAEKFANRADAWQAMVDHPYMHDIDEVFE